MYRWPSPFLSRGLWPAMVWARSAIILIMSATSRDREDLAAVAANAACYGDVLRRAPR